MKKKKQTRQQQPARRAAVQRQRKRRLRKYTLYYVLFILFAVAAGIAMSLTVFFKINAVSVRGNTKYADIDIIATGGIETGQNLFMADTRAAEQAIADRYPYIERVRVRRSFPDSVVIEVEQAKPYAALRYNLGYLLITQEGRVLDTALTDLPGGFVQVVGMEPGDVQPGESLPESCDEQLVMLSYLREALGEVPFEGLDLIDLSDRLDIRMLYEGRLILHLGSESDLSRKLRYARAIIEEKIGENFVGVLSAAEGMPTLRYRDIFADEVWPFGEALRALYRPAPPASELEAEAEPGAEEAPLDDPISDRP